MPKRDRGRMTEFLRFCKSTFVFNCITRTITTKGVSCHMPLDTNRPHERIAPLLYRRVVAYILAVSRRM